MCFEILINKSIHKRAYITKIESVKQYSKIKYRYLCILDGAHTIWIVTQNNKNLICKFKCSID